MSYNIEEINEALENEAKNWDSVTNSTSSKYFRGLKDFHLQDYFMVGSAPIPVHNMIYNYVKENNLNYEIVGYTGCATYTKIN